MTEQITFLCTLILCVMLVLAMVGARLNKVERMTGRLSTLEAKLDLLLKHSGVVYDPFKNLSPGVVESIQAGKKIEAIKRYRQETGAGLKEAKEFIEEVQRRGGLA
jgi:hypothetical protein